MGTWNSNLWNGGAPAPTVQSGVPVQPLLYAAARLAHITKFAIANQNVASPDQVADFILHANLMLDQAQVRRPMIYSVGVDTYVLGTAKIYTLGPGGTLLDANGNSVRPVKIERARLILNQTRTGIPSGRLQRLIPRVLGLAVQDIPGALPRFLYCDYAAPTAN